VLVQQDFPLGGVLGARERAASAEARAVSADEQKARLDVEYQALGAYLMWIELQRMGGVVDEQLAIAKQVFAIAKVRLSVSEAAAADVIRAKADVSKLEGERKAIDAEIASAKAMLNASLGRTIDAEVPAPDLTLPSTDPPVATDLAKIAADKRPEIVAMKARVDSARARIDEMNAMYVPMAFVRTGYARTMEEGPGLMLMIGVSVPIWREKLSAGVSEAKSMTVMAESDVAAMTKMIEGEVGAAREQVVAARVRLATTREKVLPLSKQALQLTLTNYGSGTAPLVSVLDAERLVRDTRMEEVIAELKVAVAWAKLGRAIGVVKVGVP
jgi:outer membrane protein TolC